MQLLQEAIRTVYSGKKYLEQSLKEKLEIDTLHSKKGATELPALSRREREVLQHIAANLTSQQIADQMFVSKRTIDSHRMNIMIKLNVKNGAALIKKAIQLGLIEDQPWL